MDYESRKVKWYWLLLFLLYCGTVARLLFTGNPFLYSRSELRSALTVGEVARVLPIPAVPAAGRLSTPTFFSRYSPGHTGVDPVTTPRNKNLAEFEHTSLKLESDVDVQNVSHDVSGFYVSGKSPWVVAIGLDGQIRWRFRFKSAPPAERSVLPVLLDETSVYVIHPQGEVLCLDKASGELRWSLNLKDEVVANPLLWKDHVLIPTKSADGVRLTRVQRLTGQANPDNPTLDIKPGFFVTESPDLDALILTSDNKIISVETEDWQVLWTQTVTDPIRGPAMVVGNQIFAATLGAKLVKLDGAKKGKLEWETDLIKPPAQSPTYMPIVDRVYVLDTSGTVASIDAKLGKVFWRNNLENRGTQGELFASRVKAQFIEEFKMDWLHKGWTLWAPCSESALCIYTPSKGQLITRVALAGRPVGLPQSVDRHLVFLTKGKNGAYSVSQVLEESEIKKLRASNSPPPSGAN